MSSSCIDRGCFLACIVYVECIVYDKCKKQKDTELNFYLKIFVHRRRHGDFLVIVVIVASAAKITPFLA